MKGLRSAIAELLIIAAPVAGCGEQMEPAPPIASQASEVAPDVELTLLPDWQVGDSYQIELIQEKLQVRRGVLMPTAIGRSVSQIEVAGKTESGFVLVSTLIESEVTPSENFPPEGMRMATALSKLVEGITLEVETNEDGFPIGLRNVEEVAALMRSATDEIVQSVASDPREQAQIQQAMSQMTAPNVVEAVTLKDIQVFYWLMGGSYRGGQADSYVTELPFPLTQQPIAANTHTLLRRFDEEKGLLYVAVQTVPDGNAVKAVLFDWMKGMLEVQGKQMPPGGALPVFEMQDTADYVFDLNRNLPVEVSWERYMRMGNNEVRLDRRNFRLLPTG